MNLLRINDFSSISGYAHALDAFFIVAFLYCVYYAISQFRTGKRLYLFLLITAVFYGFTLEVSGMLMHASYTQGEFLMMWDFRQFDAFKDSTDMPFYVPIFYPVWLMAALKLTEPLGIKHVGARAVAVGLSCLLLDVPYILIAPHVGWWEWHEWEVYQLWIGWPLVDGLWELTWHAFIAWCLFKWMPRIDAACDTNNGRPTMAVLLGWPLGIAILVNVVGSLFLLPISVPVYLFEGFRQYPVFALYVVVAVTIVLFSEKEIKGDFLSAKDLFLPALHWVAFVGMTLFCLRDDGGFSDYTLVQSVALYATAMMMFYPRYKRRTLG